MSAIFESGVFPTPTKSLTSKKMSRFLQHTATSKSTKMASSGELVTTNSRWEQSLRNSPIASTTPLRHKLHVTSPVLTAISSIEDAISRYRFSPECSGAIINSLKHLAIVLKSQSVSASLDKLASGSQKPSKSSRKFSVDPNATPGNVSSVVLDKDRKEKLKNAILNDLS
ncbi:hypothetical protein GEMRC1_003813 [Eukaryota sp. GEM-RC1]